MSGLNNNFVSLVSLMGQITPALQNRAQALKGQINSLADLLLQTGFTDGVVAASLKDAASSLDLDRIRPLLSTVSGFIDGQLIGTIQSINENGNRKALKTLDLEYYRTRIATNAADDNAVKILTGLVPHHSRAAAALQVYASKVRGWRAA